MKILKIAMLVFTTVLLAGCGTAPYAGQHQYQGTGREGIAGMADIQSVEADWIPSPDVGIVQMGSEEPGSAGPVESDLDPLMMDKNDDEATEGATVFDKVSLEYAAELCKEIINDWNWMNGEWSWFWELNNAGEVRADFYIQSDLLCFGSVGDIFMYPYKKIDNKFVILIIPVEARGASVCSMAYYEAYENLENELARRFPIKLGTLDIVFGEAKMPERAAMTPRKLQMIELASAKVEQECLSEKNMPGRHTLYFGNFQERVTLSIILENAQGEQWYVNCSVSTIDGYVSLIRWVPIQTDEMRFYANRIKEISVPETIKEIYVLDAAAPDAISDSPGTVIKQ